MRRSLSGISISMSSSSSGQTIDRGERGVAAGRLVERRDPHQPMHAGLGRHQAEGVLAGQRERHALQPRLFAGLVVEDLALEAAALGPLQVHAQQHLGPVLRLDPAGAGMDGDDGVGGVVLAAQHLLDLGGLDLGFERVERPGQVGGHVLAGLRPTRCSTPMSSIRCLRELRSSTSSLRRAGAAASSGRRPGCSRSRARRSRASRRLSSSSSRAASKITPQVGGPLQQVGGTTDQIIDDERHGLLEDAMRASAVRARAACATRSPIVA